MLNDITVFNIRECMSGKNDFGEEELNQLLSEFSCSKNLDVEKFLKKDSAQIRHMY